MYVDPVKHNAYEPTIAYLEALMQRLAKAESSFVEKHEALQKERETENEITQPTSERNRTYSLYDFRRVAVYTENAKDFLVLVNMGLRRRQAYEARAHTLQGTILAVRAVERSVATFSVFPETKKDLTQIENMLRQLLEKTSQNSSEHIEYDEFVDYSKEILLDAFKILEKHITELLK
jgi:hypothetical protein